MIVLSQLLEVKVMKVNKLYRCPVCGETLTNEEYEHMLESGGGGHCMCEFSAYDEHGDIWFPRILNEYQVFILQEEQ